MAMVTRIRYTLSIPGKKDDPNRWATIEGEPQPKDYAELEYLLAHPWGEGAAVSNVRAVDAKGNPLPDPPAFVRAAAPTPAADTPLVVE